MKAESKYQVHASLHAKPMPNACFITQVREAQARRGFCAVVHECRMWFDVRTKRMEEGQ